MKPIVSTLLASIIALSFGLNGLSAQESSEAVKNPYTGRIQHKAPPRSGDGAMTHMDHPIPAENVRVGPSAVENVGLAYMIGIEAHEAGRNALLMADKITLIVDVLGVDAYHGAPPSPLTVALLTTQGHKNETWSKFGAWNLAEQYTAVGLIESDPVSGTYAFDITEAIQAAPLPTEERPIIYFAIFSPVKDLIAANAGKHVLFGAEGDKAPRIDIQ